MRYAFFSLPQTLSSTITHNYTPLLTVLFLAHDAFEFANPVRQLMTLRVFKLGRRVIQHCFQKINLVLCAGSVGSGKD